MESPTESATQVTATPAPPAPARPTTPAGSRPATPRPATLPMHHRPADAARRPARGDARLADAIGWFSVGLGLAQLVVPDRVARLVGVETGTRGRAVMRTLGARELASGIGILTASSPGPWLWARVAGDVTDLALLGNVATEEQARRRRTAAAAAAVLGIAALDAVTGERLTRQPGMPQAARGIHVTRSITVNRQPDEVYAFWRDLERLPRFMRHLESVQVVDERRSRWTARAPAGLTVAWDAELVEDRPGELLAWRSLPGADVQNAGTVRFRPAPGGRGTEVTVELRYDPPGGAMTEQLARLFREEPGQQVRDDLRAFKQVLEIGEVLLSDATARPGAHAAQPSAPETVD
ncbi:MAG TPA: SRPBCC family protein [Gemmatimonadaceae bacterium]|nr:SRPBCC family protein [Gemmatimonadaceae bacterium]